MPEQRNDNAEILTGYTIALHHFFGNGGGDAFSILVKLCVLQTIRQYPVLVHGPFMEGFIDDMGKIHALFHEQRRRPHRVRRGVGILEHTAVIDDPGIQALRDIYVHFIKIKEACKDFRTGTGARDDMVDIPKARVRDMVVDRYAPFREVEKILRNGDALVFADITGDEQVIAFSRNGFLQ